MTTPNDSFFGRTLSGIRNLGSETGTKTKLNKIVGDYKKSKGRRRLGFMLMSLCTLGALGGGIYYGARKISNAVTTTTVPRKAEPVANVSTWLDHVASTAKSATPSPTFYTSPSFGKKSAYPTMKKGSRLGKHGKSKHRRHGKFSKKSKRHGKHARSKRHGLKGKHKRVAHGKVKRHGKAIAHSKSRQAKRKHRGHKKAHKKANKKPQKPAA